MTIMADLTAELEDILHTLNTGGVPTYPIDDYIRNFWPYIISINDEDRQYAMGEWARKIAGSSTKPVDLLDSAGNIVTRVPPIFTSGMLSDESLEDIHSLMEQYTQAMRSNPQVAVRRLNETIPNLVLTTKDLASLPQYVTDILSYMGVELKDTPHSDIGFDEQFEDQ